MESGENVFDIPPELKKESLSAKLAAVFAPATNPADKRAAFKGFEDAGGLFRENNELLSTNPENESSVPRSIFLLKEILIEPLANCLLSTDREEILAIFKASEERGDFDAYLRLAKEFQENMKKAVENNRSAYNAQTNPQTSTQQATPPDTLELTTTIDPEEVEVPDDEQHGVPEQQGQPPTPRQQPNQANAPSGYSSLPPRQSTQDPANPTGSNPNTRPLGQPTPSPTLQRPIVVNPPQQPQQAAAHYVAMPTQPQGQPQGQQPAVPSQPQARQPGPGPRPQPPADEFTILTSGADTRPEQNPAQSFELTGDMSQRYPNYLHVLQEGMQAVIAAGEDIANQNNTEIQNRYHALMERITAPSINYDDLWDINQKIQFVTETANLFDSPLREQILSNFDDMDDLPFDPFAPTNKFDEGAHNLSAITRDALDNVRTSLASRSTAIPQQTQAQQLTSLTSTLGAQAQNPLANAPNPAHPQPIPTQTTQLRFRPPAQAPAPVSTTAHANTTVDDAKWAEIKQKVKTDPINNGRGQSFDESDPNRISILRPNNSNIDITRDATGLNVSTSNPTPSQADLENLVANYKIAAKVLKITECEISQTAKTLDTAILIKELNKDPKIKPIINPVLLTALQSEATSNTNPIYKEALQIYNEMNKPAPRSSPSPI